MGTIPMETENREDTRREDLAKWLYFWVYEKGVDGKSWEDFPNEEWKDEYRKSADEILAIADRKL